MKTHANLWKALIKSHERYCFKINVQYPEKRHDLHNHLQAPHERMVIEKVGKLTTKLHDKRYVIHITLKQAVNHWFVLKKVHWVIKFNQKSWLEPYIDMNKEIKIWKKWY